MNSVLRIAGIFLLGIFLGTAGVVGFVLYQKHQPQESKEPSRQSGVETVKADTARTWNDRLLGPERRLHSDTRESIHRATALAAFNNSLFVGDYGDMQIKRFSPEGALIRVYEDTSRRGRGRNRHLMGYTVTPSGELYVQDHRHRELLRFDAASGTLREAISLDYRPYRLLSVGSHLVAQALVSDSLFRVYDSGGEIVAEFGKLIENQRLEATDIAGDIVPASQPGQFVFAPSRASYLIWYDLEGNEIRRVVTPDRIPLRKKGVGSLGNLNFMRPAQSKPAASNVRVYDLATDGSRLYVSMSELDEESGSSYSYVDIYALDSGNYLQSFRLPSLANDIVVMNGTFYYVERKSESLRAFEMRADPS